MKLNVPQLLTVTGLTCLVIALINTFIATFTDNIGDTVSGLSFGVVGLGSVYAAVHVRQIKTNMGVDTIQQGVELKP